MINQNKIFSFEIKCQAKNIFLRDVEKTVDFIVQLSNNIKKDIVVWKVYGIENVCQWKGSVL